MDAIKPGDFVRLIGQETIGEVISVKGNNLELAIGLMKVSIKKDKVKLTVPPMTVESAPEHYQVDTKEKMLHFKFELDIRGELKENVLLEVSRWIDDALLLGVEEARIIHGRGNGVLKDAVRGLLRKYKDSIKYGDESKEKGGDSVTKVVFSKI